MSKNKLFGLVKKGKFSIDLFFTVASQLPRVVMGRSVCKHTPVKPSSPADGDGCVAPQPHKPFEKGLTENF